MALFAYQQMAQRLIRDTLQKDTAPADLTTYINEGRTQLAGESKSIRVLGTFSITANNPGPYLYSSITLSGASGVAGVLDVEQMWYASGSGRVWFRSRPWPWYSIYKYNVVAPVSGPPTEWAQYAQGVNGSAFVTYPDQTYTITADCVCYPSPLVSDTTVEAIPVPWTAAIPYYAAYLALLAAQTREGEAAADKMFARYELFVGRGRQFTTPDIVPTNFAQVPNPVRSNQLGEQSQTQGGQ